MNIKSISLQTYNNLIVTGNERKMWFNFWLFFFNCDNENTEFKLAYSTWLGHDEYNL